MSALVARLPPEQQRERAQTARADIAAEPGAANPARLRGACAVVTGVSGDVRQEVLCNADFVIELLDCWEAGGPPQGCLLAAAAVLNAYQGEWAPLYVTGSEGKLGGFRPPCARGRQSCSHRRRLALHA